LDSILYPSAFHPTCLVHCVPKQLKASILTTQREKNVM
jgi:hypothetical protein